MTKELTREAIWTEKKGHKCFCLKKKPSGAAFCNAHFNAIPEPMRPKLKRLFCEGYEKDYRQAREYLESIAAQPSLI